MTLAQPKFTWPARNASAKEVLRWGIAEFGEGLAICTSFQATGSVILDMAAGIAGDAIQVFSIDTGRLSEETYELIAAVRRRYGISVELVAPHSEELSSMLTLHGPNLFYEHPAKRRLCCEIRKVRPLKRRLSTLDAWVTGPPSRSIRQSPSGRECRRRRRTWRHREALPAVKLVGRRSIRVCDPARCSAAWALRPRLSQHRLPAVYAVRRRWRKQPRRALVVGR